MNDNAQAVTFDCEETGRIHAQELIKTLARECHTIEAFIESRVKVRRALLEALDAFDPAQVVEDAQQNVMPGATRVRLADESEQRRKDRGSLQDPLFPPTHLNHWD